ncbi:MAG: rod shape determining protein RodA [Pyrinomonadaceae bacterium]|jgi:rod shape determining protein RodA|nr:rod shape determining protein RodA [Pyrinomonadaceae bacterium]MDQ1592705.1 rod shape determining protein RodA [Pyrinomonadaceae bacterium]
MVAILEKGRFRDFDWLLTLLATGIVFFGTWQIHNAQPLENYWKKQLIGLAISLVALFAVAFTDYRKLVHFAPAFYLFGLVLLVLVLIPGIGLRINGQQCWIRMPVVGQFQPSEFVKIPTVLMLAYYYGKQRGNALGWMEIAVGVGILALPAGLILLEPDAGQVITYVPLLAVVLFLSSVRMWVVLASLALSVVLIPAAYVVGVKTGKIKNYQQQRIQAIIDPEKADRKGYGYQTYQSILSVGKGGVAGTGGGSTEYSQSRLKFLPEPHSDFIFAVTAERTGFVGSILLLVAYAVLLSRLLMGARRAPDRAGMLVIMAIVGGLAFQIFINVGMALGLLPVIGVPLPMMSAGLSSVLATFIAIGFAVSVQLRRFVN